jgi:predicted GNAT family N-acyltransferase
LRTIITISDNEGDIKLAQTIRRQVFVIEQGIPVELDLDGEDSKALHALAYSDDRPVATARLLIEGDKATLARVAVIQSHRGKGIATLLVKRMLQEAEWHRVKTVIIHAHEYLNSYYQRLGFEYLKDVETVGEHQLIEMEFQVNQSPDK